MESIEHIIYLKTPIEKVYTTLTTKAGLSQIWTKKLMVKPEIGFVNEFDFDEGYLTKFKILELTENQKIVWECIESDQEWIGTKVSFELLEKDGIVKLTLKHSGWKALTDFYRWCNYNWAMFLFRLKTYSEL